MRTARRLKCPLATCSPDTETAVRLDSKTHFSPTLSYTNPNDAVAGQYIRRLSTIFTAVCETKRRQLF